MITGRQRRVFQKVFFLKGIRVASRVRLFEPDTDSLFSVLGSVKADLLNLASPTGFEPVFPP